MVADRLELANDILRRGWRIVQEDNMMSANPRQGTVTGSCTRCGPEVRTLEPLHETDCRLPEGSSCARLRHCQPRYAAISKKKLASLHTQSGAECVSKFSHDSKQSLAVNVVR
jgi:hypothetical protein